MHKLSSPYCVFSFFFLVILSDFFSCLYTRSLSHTHYVSDNSTLLELDSLQFALLRLGAQVSTIRINLARVSNSHNLVHDFVTVNEHIVFQEHQGPWDIHSYVCFGSSLYMPPFPLLRRIVRPFLYLCLTCVKHHACVEKRVQRKKKENKIEGDTNPILCEK